MFEPLQMDVFSERTGITHDDLFRRWSPVVSVVSLRQLKDVESVHAMPLEYLRQLLGRVCLSGNEEVRVYEGCSFSVAHVDPRTVRVGQTFVERQKYQALVEEFRGIFGKFCVAEGISRMSPMLILGRDILGNVALAHYVPPIVEMNGETKGNLLDGLHRHFIARSVGTTLESVIVEHARAPFPCDMHDWGDISVVSEKPKKEERFFNLRPDLFRDVKYVGIDG